MSCRHAKPRGPLAIKILWCDACAEKEAGPKPKNKWKHGDLARSRSWEDSEFGIQKVLDSEMSVIGQATDSPKWSEYLVFRDGGGSASLFRKVKIVEDES